ncbi:MAG TPA: cobalt-precorrin-5B (C(1))-methyltransferase CbiD [Syntrophobacteraceae bacterium]|nr:cobalt-precorrin-5B (C(1))-methyltransferase CbiD [Syntrophobacteraceae bacterium]
MSGPSPDSASKSGSKRGRDGRAPLRCGFSTGTAASAAARAALRHLITGVSCKAVAVRLPSGAYLEVPVAWSTIQSGAATASVIKDAGDDPDITNGAEIRATVTILVAQASRARPTRNSVRGRLSQDPDIGSSREARDLPRILLVAGKGVGLVTKPGLPAAPGEPAINPVPRRMLSENITLELLGSKNTDLEPLFLNCSDPAISTTQDSGAYKPTLELHLYEGTGATAGALSRVNNFSVMVEIEVPRGEELSRHTLNPRLGIVGGISILGTTGIVKPFSNEAYKQTIRASFSVAASNGCRAMVLSTGGKSERLAREMLSELPIEAFVQIADFFSFAVREARSFGFSRIIHSVFLGKAIKMAQGHPYTHAHSVPLDLEFLACTARSLGYDEIHCGELASANTARHALDIIERKDSYDILESVAQKAAAQSAQLAGGSAEIRLLLFDYAGRLLADVKRGTS